MHGTLRAGGSDICEPALDTTERSETNKRTERTSGSARLKGLVDVLGPVLVGLFRRQLGLFELQELPPKNLKEI